MSKRLNQEREQQLQPKRMEYAIEQLEKIGIVITNEPNSNVITFNWKGSQIKFYPYSGWATGKTIIDGRGIEKLIAQLKK